MLKPIVLAATFAALSAGLRADDPQDVSHALEKIRDAHEVPALAAAAVDEGKIVAMGVSGFRKQGGEEHATLQDCWHLGSCTKSMTASVAAMLVEEGKLRWDSTVGEVLGRDCFDMNEEWKGVTMEQLLVHRGGAPHDAPADIWTVACGRLGTPSEQRLAFIQGLLVKPPDHKPGSRWVYSDSGYAIVGTMMERVTGEPWEKLMRERLFEPLGLTSAGFGEPGKAGLVDQPWGHRGYEAPYKPISPGEADADNPPSIGPAETVHMSLADFARYTMWHLAGARGDGWLLTPESFEKLHTPADGQEYAMGWAVTKRKWAGGTALMHNGENEMFYAVMWLGPGENTSFVAVCNADGAMAADACNDAIRMLINRY